ncbi:MAG: DUF4860 domain-containing protein [Lachnospiraceae bacterium]|nr:DUF4860 domain-containing protein [Lachnospiraceae bacterium]
MKGKLQKHNIEAAFVLVLFAVFAVTIVAVLALGANSYKSLVERDNEAYNKRIITSYITAKIRSNDMAGTVAVGGFAKPEEEDGVNTLHLYQMIEGQKFDLRIYYYDGQIYELFTTADNDIEPEAGNPIIEAKGLSFMQEGSVIQISSVDAGGLENTATVAVRSESEVAP